MINTLEVFPDEILFHILNLGGARIWRELECAWPKLARHCRENKLSWHNSRIFRVDYPAHGDNCKSAADNMYRRYQIMMNWRGNLDDHFSRADSQYISLLRNYGQDDVHTIYSDVMGATQHSQVHDVDAAEKMCYRCELDNNKSLMLPTAHNNATTVHYYRDIETGDAVPHRDYAPAVQNMHRTEWMRLGVKHNDNGAAIRDTSCNVNEFFENGIQIHLYNDPDEYNVEHSIAQEIMWEEYPREPYMRNYMELLEEPSDKKVVNFANKHWDKLETMRNDAILYNEIGRYEGDISYREIDEYMFDKRYMFHGTKFDIAELRSNKDTLSDSSTCAKSRDPIEQTRRCASLLMEVS